MLPSPTHAVSFFRGLKGEMLALRYLAFGGRIRQVTISAEQHTLAGENVGTHRAAASSQPVRPQSPQGVLLKQSFVEGLVCDRASSLAKLAEVNGDLTP